MNKKIIAFLLFSILCLQSSLVCAIEASNTKHHVKKLDKKQYAHKKVTKKYTPHVVTIVNNDKKTILLSSDSEIILTDENSNEFKAEKQRDVYRKIRRRDVGKFYSFGIPCATVGGAVIGFTFGLGTPIAIGLWILGERPAHNAANENYEIVQEFLINKGLPLRLEPKEINQILLLVPKNKSINKIKITNAFYENNKKEKIDLTLDLSMKEQY